LPLKGTRGGDPRRETPGSADAQPSRRRLDSHCSVVAQLPLLGPAESRAYNEAAPHRALHEHCCNLLLPLLGRKGAPLLVQGLFRRLEGRVVRCEPVTHVEMVLQLEAPHVELPDEAPDERLRADDDAPHAVVLGSVDATPLASGYQRRTSSALEEVTVVRHHPPNGLHEDRCRNRLAKRVPRNSHSHLGLQHYHGGAAVPQPGPRDEATNQGAVARDRATSVAQLSACHGAASGCFEVDRRGKVLPQPPSLQLPAGVRMESNGCPLHLPVGHQVRSPPAERLNCD
tara:strand:+ start:150 stop:1007 length:858 start_codon:yes stop_codon:yes gene_type:complete